MVMKMDNTTIMAENAASLGGKLKGDIFMAIENFAASREYKKFAETNGEDTFIRMNLMYIAFEMNDIYTEDGNQNGEFDELCEDVLEIYLDEQFDSYNVVDVADGVAFIITDSNYSIAEYTGTYKRNRGKICEELLAYLEKTRRKALQKTGNTH
jgi:hypothetical protein